MYKNIKYILLPLSFLYKIVLIIRHSLYDTQFFSSKKFNFPVISIGNITVGGTGKTPFADYLLQLLKKDHQIAYLSRGYKRKTSGFQLADEKSTPVEIGDEAFQILVNHPEVTIAVCEKRVPGVEQLHLQKPDIEVIILDDALQHRAIKPSLNILLIDFNRPFFSDWLLPLGQNRDLKSAAQKIDCAVFTKCPSILKKDEKEKLKESVYQECRKKIPVFFTGIVQKEILPVLPHFGQPVSASSWILISGLAEPEPFIKQAKADKKVVKSLVFPDHFNYTFQNLRTWHEMYEGSKNLQFLTTEKDAVKLSFLLKAHPKFEIPIFYQKISIQFLEEETIFNQLIFNHLKDFNPN